MGGGDGRKDRPPDLPGGNRTLSQLSYTPGTVSPVFRQRPRSRFLVGLERFELSPPRLSSVCSNQLSYRPLSARGADHPAGLWPRPVLQKNMPCSLQTK